MTSNERDPGPDSPDSPEWVDPWSWRAYPDPPPDPGPSAAEELAPAEDEAAGDEPAEDEVAPAGDEVAPAGDEVAPAGDEAAGDEPAEDEVAPAGDEAAGDEPAEAEPDATEAADSVPSGDGATVEMPPVVVSDESVGVDDEDEAEPDASGEPEAAEDGATQAASTDEAPVDDLASDQDPFANEADGEDLGERGESLDPADWAERARLLEDVEESRRVPLAEDDLWQPDVLAGLAEPGPDELAGEDDQDDDEGDEGDAAEVPAAGPVAPRDRVAPPDPEAGEATQPLPPVPVARPSRPVAPPPPPVVLVPPPPRAAPPARTADPEPLEPLEPPEPAGPAEPRARRPAIRIVPTTPGPTTPGPTTPGPTSPGLTATPEPTSVEPATPPPATPESATPESAQPPAARMAPPAPVPTPWLRPVDPVTPGWIPEAGRPPEPDVRPGRALAAPFPPVRLPEPPRDRGPRQLQPSPGGTVAPTGAPSVPSPPWLDRPSHWTRPEAPGARWGLPPTPVPRRTSARRTWIIVVAVLAVLAVAGYQFVALVRSGHEEPATTRRAAAGRPGQAGTSASPVSPEQQVTRLLATRSAAVLHHDKAAFLATVDRQRTSFYHSQAVLFDRMATVPFSAFSYSVPSPLQDLATESSRQRYSPAMVFTYPVEASYRFKGQDTNPLLARFYYTFEVTRGAWRIAGQDDVRAPLRSDVEIWDAGVVRTLSTTRTLVVFHPGDAILARRLLAVAERGYGQVAASWSASWDKRVVILLPADQKEAQRLVRTRDLSDVAAVTSSAIEAGPAHRLLGNRIIVNTSLIAGYRSLDLQVVMTHEMTHVATRNVGVGVPLYLVEGFADYTALRPLAAPLRLTRPSLAAAVRAERFKGKLPSRSQLVGADAALAYDEGSSFCLWVASAFGEGKLQALYRSFGDLDTDPTLQDEDVRFRRVLGISRATAENRWAAFVKGAV
jgi:hypothetical protein